MAFYKCPRKKAQAIYGVEWNFSATKGVRTDAAASFSDPVPYCNENGNVHTTDCTSPFDSLMPWSGMQTTQDTAGDLVAIPKFYYKWTNTQTGLKLQIASEAVDGFHVSPAHLNRDGNGERDVVYCGSYPCGPTYASTKYQTPQTADYATFKSNIASLGNEYRPYDISMEMTLVMLILAEYGTWNLREAFPRLESNSYNYRTSRKTGFTADMPYHTGTLSLNQYSSYQGILRYRNIEVPFSILETWIPGITISGSSPNLSVNIQLDDNAQVISAPYTRWTTSSSAESVTKWAALEAAGAEFMVLCPGGYSTSGSVTPYFGRILMNSIGRMMTSCDTDKYVWNQQFSRHSTATQPYSRVMKIPS